MSALRPCTHCAHLVASTAKACPSCGAKNPYPVGCGSTLFALAMMVALGVWAASSCEGMQGQSSGRAALAGDTAVLRVADGGNVAVCASEADLDRFTDLANAKDTAGISQMILAGRILLVPTGTRCKVIDPGLMVYEVRVSEGKHAGRAVFVTREHVARTKTPSTRGD